MTDWRHNMDAQRALDSHGNRRTIAKTTAAAVILPDRARSGVTHPVAGTPGEDQMKIKVTVGTSAAAGGDSRSTRPSE
jgi:hypothetical protein